MPSRLQSKCFYQSVHLTNYYFGVRGEMSLTKFIVGLLVKLFSIYPCGMKVCMVECLAV